MDDTPMVAPEPSLAELTPVPLKSGDGAPSWVHTNLRNLLALGMGAVVFWLAVKGNEQAQAAIIAAFTMLVGHVYGERSALKRPGQDG